jgi:hypothetical protein
MGFKPAQLGIIAIISLAVSAVVVYASNNVDAVEDSIG